jgi:nucleoside 2-deoxyribosyltransferase
MIKSAGIDFSLLDLLEEWIEKQNLISFTPGKLEDTEPEIIFDRDMAMLNKSDYIIADVNEPSHGVGMEIMYAFEHKMPVICVLHKNNKPFSRLGEGSPHLYLIEYENKNDLEIQLNRIELKETIIDFCESCQKNTIHIDKVCKKCKK